MKYNMPNYDKFEQLYIDQLETLFKTCDDYAYVAARTTPVDLAKKMTEGLSTGSASKDGQAVKNVCKILGIKHTYKAIQEYLKS